MTATTANHFDTSAAAMLDACSDVRRYLRRIPPDCRSRAIAALAELERRIRAGDDVCAGSADK
jgi:hypothetical protein